MRQYTAFCDNGRDYFSFEYYSDHRKGSKANTEDAIKTWKRAHGWNSRIKVLSVTYNKEPIC